MRKRKTNPSETARLASARDHAGHTGDGGLAIFTADGQLVSEAPAEIAEGLRYSITRLERAGGGRLPDVLALTAALSGEGVTYTCQSLGAVLANDFGRTVAVVELNFGRPCSTSQPVGIAQVVHGEVPLDQALVRTEVPGLVLLPAGRTAVSDRPVLSRMTALAETLADLRRRVDHVVLDVPAVLDTSDAVPLAAYADAVGLVLRHGVTSEHQAQRAVEDLAHLTFLGVILNRWTSPVPTRLLAAIAP